MIRGWSGEGSVKTGRSDSTSSYLTLSSSDEDGSAAAAAGKSGCGFAREKVRDGLGVVDFFSFKRLKRELNEFLAREGHAGLELHDRLSNLYVGLVNQGATCYLNSLLQTLFFQERFRKLIYDWKPEKRKGFNSEKSIHKQMQLLFAKMQFAEVRAVSTKGLTFSFGWSPAQAYEQQDVQELCRVLFDKLENDDVGKALTKPFKGSLMDYLQCQKCKHRRAKREEFQDISLVVEGVNSVGEAMKKFVEVERLEGDNQYFCEKCNEKVDAVKGHRLVLPPRVLALHLKRFSFDWNTERRVKDCAEVEVPLSLSIEDLMREEAYHDAMNSLESPGLAFADTESFSESLWDDIRKSEEAFAPSTSSEHFVYDLSSIIVHQGSANSGHYFAIVKSGDRKWLECNDDFVTPVTETELQRKCGPGGQLSNGGAYMLFYNCRSDLKEKQEISNPSPPDEIIEDVEIFNEYRSKLRRIDQVQRKYFSVTIEVGPVSDTDSLMKKRISIQINSEIATVVDLKHIAFMRLFPKHMKDKNGPIALKNAFLSIFDEVNCRIGRTFAMKDTDTLVDAKIVNHASLLLHFRGVGCKTTRMGSFEKRQVRICFWSSDFSCIRPAAAEANVLEGDFATETCFSINKCWLPLIVESSRVSDLLETVAKEFSIGQENTGLLRIKRERSTIVALVELGTDDFLDNDDNEVVVTNQNVLPCSQITEEFREAQNYFNINFNDPRLNAPDRPTLYEFCIRVHKDSSLQEVKEKLLKSLSSDLPEDCFHLRSGPKRPQMKDTTRSLVESGISNHGILHIGKGKPVPFGMTAIRVFEGRKMLKRVNVPDNISVKDANNLIASELDLRNENRKLRLVDRNVKGDILEVLPEEKLLADTVKKFSDGKSFVFRLEERNPMEWKPGQHVLARADDKSRYHPGVIFSVDHSHQTCAIDFDDGDRIEVIPISQVQRDPLTTEEEKGKDLCPSDKADRKKERAASFETRLDLLNIDKDENSQRLPAIEKQPRAQSSPSRSRDRMCSSNGVVRQKRVQSSKISRSGGLSPLMPLPKKPSSPRQHSPLPKTHRKVIPSPRDDLFERPPSRAGSRSHLPPLERLPR